MIVAGKTSVPVSGDASIHTAYYESPCGMLELRATASHVCSVRFTEMMGDGSAAKLPLLQDCIEELGAFFSGKLTRFKTPLQPAGTLFQQRVWKHLSEIPFGETITYRDLAIRMGNRQVIRAAARANGANPIAILIPCHRVVGTNGKLTGYAGGLWRKDFLLKHEAMACGKLTGLFSEAATEW